MIMFRYIIWIFRLGVTLIFIVFFSCDDFVDVDSTNSRVTTDVVFNDDNTAKAAMIGAYYDMANSVINAGRESNMNMLSGLSSDELVLNRRNENLVQFLGNSLTPINPVILNVWNSLYKVIYEVNAIIEGVESSDGLSSNVRDELLGEARFVRAFCYFYLVNFFGDVPIVKDTDYRKNSLLVRSDASDIYNFIVDDLLSAKGLLSDNYPASQRTHPNSMAVSAFLAKVYLFLNEWEKAEAESSVVIGNSNYEIVQNPDEVFLIESKEAIWQIAPIDNLNNANEAISYVIVSSPKTLGLRDEFVDVFEDGDVRLSNWIGYVVVSGDTVYYPHKYKLQATGLPTKQYSVILRLSEQYLIRAEARARLENLSGAIEDLDVVRRRAGVLLIGDTNPLIGQFDLIIAIDNERRRELFTESSNRWFDLKRTQSAVDVLSVFKNDFVGDDGLYPIPQIEFRKNPNLGDQNHGY
jgi:hypothetical protein